MQDAWRAYLEMALGLTEAPRKKAQRVAGDLVSRGGATAAQVQGLVEDLMTTGMANREALTNIVRYEVDRALGLVGLATSDEVSELTARVHDLERQLREAQSRAVATEGEAPVVAGTEGTRIDRPAPTPGRGRTATSRAAAAGGAATGGAAAGGAAARKAVAKKAIAKAVKATPNSMPAAAGPPATAKKAVAKKAVRSAADKAAADSTAAAAGPAKSSPATPGGTAEAPTAVVKEAAAATELPPARKAAKKAAAPAKKAAARKTTTRTAPEATP